MSLLLAASSLAFGADLPDDLQVVVDRAAEARLPIEPLEDKVREGLAKGVPEPRIAGVLTQMVSDWQSTATLLGARAEAPDRPALVPAAAAALHQGAEADTVVELAADVEAVDALWTLTDLLSSGLSPDEGARLVRQALASRDPDLALHQLPEATHALVGPGGANAAGATRALEGAMQAGGTPLAAVTSTGPAHGDKSKAGGNGNGPDSDNGNHNGADHGNGVGKGGKAP